MPITGFRQLTVAVAGAWVLASTCAASQHLPGQARAPSGEHAPRVTPVRAPSTGPTQRAGPRSCAEAGTELLARAGQPVPAVPIVAEDRHRAIAPVPARSVYDFVSSVGVNVHTTYTDTPYRKHRRVAAALRDLGIRHIRDGFMPDRDHDQYPFLRDLADQGICASLIVGGPHVDADHVDETLDDLARVAPVVELVEGPNEADLALGDTWSSQVRDYQVALAEEINQRPDLGDVPLLGPSLGRLDAWDERGDLSHVLDAGNIHPYPGGRPPSETLRDNRAAARGVSGDLPLVATEHGYHNAIRGHHDHPGVPERVAAVYVPRLFLESFASGIPRTYLYELLDEFSDPQRDDPEANFGLLRHDFSRKPAARALDNLLTVLGARDARPHPTGALAVAVESRTADVRAVLLQGTDGTYWLAVWRDLSVYDVASAARIDVIPTDVRVVLAEPARVKVFRPVHSDRVVHRARATTRVELSLTAGVQLISLRKGGAHG